MPPTRKIAIIYLLHRCFREIYSFLTERTQPTALRHPRGPSLRASRCGAGNAYRQPDSTGRQEEILVGTTQPGLLRGPSQRKGRSV